MNGEIFLEGYYTQNMNTIARDLYPIVHKILRCSKLGEEANTVVKREYLEKIKERHQDIIEKMREDFVEVYLKIDHAKLTIDDFFEDGTTYRTIIHEG